jgi:mannan polymerase II complex MNN11 subunit
MSSFRRKRLKQGAVIACGALSIIFLIYRLFSSKPPMVYDRIPTGAPEVVIVTVLDPSMSEEYVATVKENRQDYAKRHGTAPSACLVVVPNLP